MNTRVISYLLGKISVLMGLAQVINFLLALYYGEDCYKEFDKQMYITVKYQ